jgi:hypothetical protein
MLDTGRLPVSQKYGVYKQTKFTIASTAMAVPAIAHELLGSPLTPKLELAVSSAVVTLVLPVAVIPFKRSAVLMAGPTFQKSTSIKVGFVPHSLLHSVPCAPNAPIVLVLAEFVVAISVTSGTDIPKTSTVSAKWFNKPMYPDDMAEEEEERDVGRERVQLKPLRDETPKAVSKT